MSARIEEAFAAIDRARATGMADGTWPGWEQENPAPTIEQRRRWALWYAHRLWRGLDGWVCIATGAGGHLGPTGKYDFESFTQRFHRWPDEFERDLGRIIAASDEADICVAPMLRAERARTKGTGASARFAWADVDGEWTIGREERWAQVWAGGSFMVSSGNGRHLYVDLGDVTPMPEVVELNRRLMLHFDADAKWDDAALLRLPGSFNHKGRARGGSSKLVRVTV